MPQFKDTDKVPFRVTALVDAEGGQITDPEVLNKLEYSVESTNGLVAGTVEDHPEEARATEGWKVYNAGGPGTVDILKVTTPDNPDFLATSDPIVVTTGAPTGATIAFGTPI